MHNLFHSEETDAPFYDRLSPFLNQGFPVCTNLASSSSNPAMTLAMSAGGNSLLTKASSLLYSE